MLICQLFTSHTTWPCLGAESGTASHSSFLFNVHLEKQQVMVHISWSLSPSWETSIDFLASVSALS